MAGRACQGILLALCCAALASGQSRPAFTGRLRSGDVSIDGRVVAIVEAAWVEQGGKSFRLHTPLAPAPKNLELECVTTQATSAPGESGVRHVVRFTCMFRPLGPGKAETGPIEAPYLPSDLADLLAGGAVDGAPERFTGRVPSLEVRIAGRSYAWLWAALAASAVAVLVVAVLVVAMLVKRAKALARPARAGPDAGLEREALARLMALRTLRIEGESKAYVGRVAELLAHYVRARFGVDAADASASAAHIGGSPARRLADVVARAEKIRYAGEPPADAELDRIASFAEALLRDHMPDANADPLKEIRVTE